MTTVFLVIPNYVYTSDLLRTRFIGALADRLRVVVFLPVASETYPRHPNIVYVPWRLQFPSFWTFWGKTIRVPLIRMFDHEPLIQRNYQLSFSHWKRKLLRAAAFLFPKRFWNPDFIAGLERYFLPKCEAFERYVREYRPSLLLTPTPGFTEIDAEAIALAGRLGIPTAAIDFSWDNLTSNCKHLRKPGYLICWTERMRETAVRMHRFDPARVFVSGIMRFDHYFRENNANLRIDANAANAERTAVRGLGREEFLRSKGLDPSEKTVLIATVTRGNYKDEPEIVRALLKARSAGAFPGSPNLFIRVHPKEDNIEDYKAFAGEERLRLERAGAPMAQNLGSRIELGEADLVNLKHTLEYADVVVNYASTITIEAFAFDKPVVNIGFPPYYLNAYSFTHYKPVAESGAVRIAKSMEELIAEVASYLKNPERDRENRRAAVREFIGFTDGKSYQRTAEIIEDVVKSLK